MVLLFGPVANFKLVTTSLCWDFRYRKIEGISRICLEGYSCFSGQVSSEALKEPVYLWNPIMQFSSLSPRVKFSGREQIYL